MTICNPYTPGQIKNICNKTTASMVIPIQAKQTKNISSNPKNQAKYHRLSRGQSCTMYTAKLPLFEEHSACCQPRLPSGLGHKRCQVGALSRMHL